MIHAPRRDAFNILLADKGIKMLLACQYCEIHPPRLTPDMNSEGMNSLPFTLRLRLECSDDGAYKHNTTGSCQVGIAIGKRILLIYHIIWGQVKLKCGFMDYPAARWEGWACMTM